MPNINHYQNALILARHGNFGRAAKALNISQPTLSRSIQALEKQLGDLLFNRGKKGIIPTQAGEIMLKHAGLVIAASESLEEELKRHQGILEGVINIGAGTYVGTALLAPALIRFNQLYPGIDINITVGNWDQFTDSLYTREFDFVMFDTSELGVLPNFKFIKLQRHQAFFFCRPEHPLLQLESLALPDLAKFPLISSVLPARIIQLFKQAFFPYKQKSPDDIKLNHIICNDQAIIKTTVANSDAIAIASYGMLADELESELFSVLPFRLPGLHGNYHIVKRRGLISAPAVNAFIQVLLELDKQQSLSEAPLVSNLRLVEIEYPA